MKRTIAVLALFISVVSCAQNGTISVAFCPLAALDGSSFPTIQGGIEWRPAHRLSWYNELGIEYMTTPLARPDTAIIHPWGIKFKTELRYYLAPATYLAFNLFITSDAHNTALTYSPGDTLWWKTDAIGVHKNVFGWNFVWGKEKRLGGRFWMDWYAGVGMRLRHIRTVGEQYDPNKDWLLTATDLNFYDIRVLLDYKTGWSTTANITAGVRLVYRL